MLQPVLLAGQDGEQRWFGGRRDLDCSAPRVQWLRTPLCGKAEAQGSRPSKPEKKGTRPIGNSRGIAARVGRLLSGSGKALDTFLCPLHESGLVEGGRMYTGASRSCLMRRVRGGPVGGESETGHGQGQTITRSIEDDIQTEEYRGYRGYLY